MNAAHLSSCLVTLAALVAGTCAGAGEGAHGATDRRTDQLERQVASLRESYMLARADADAARKQLREVSMRLEALGGTALGGQEGKLIETAAMLESTRSELDEVRQGSLRLVSAVAEYKRNAMVEDETARQTLETALQELEVALGLRQKQQSELDGTLDEAKVLSIDSESGLIVINAGRKGGVEVGMPMEISRGDQVIAETMVTDVRKSVSGLLVQRHLNPVLSIAVGDRVSVKTND
ncbi:MAG: hypothetical protein IIV41_00295 [Akkermansia sp.]|nr:hypothetical protein [Akkermansia sp.]